MAYTPVGLYYPRLRGKVIQIVNAAMNDIINVLIQFNLDEMPKDRKKREARIWKAIRDYAIAVIKYHKY